MIKVRPDGNIYIMADGSTVPLVDYIKTKTRQEHGSVKHNNTKNVKVKFAKSFIQKPKVYLTMGGGLISNITSNGFTHTFDVTSNESVNYVAMPVMDDEGV